MTVLGTKLVIIGRKKRAFLILMNVEEIRHLLSKGANLMPKNNKTNLNLKILIMKIQITLTKVIMNKKNK